MNIAGLFKSTEMELPKERPCDDFEKYIEDIFGKYLDLLSTLDEEDELSRQVKSAVPDIDVLCLKIRKSLRWYLEGYPCKSLDALKEGIKAVDTHFSRLYTPPVSPEAQHGINPHLYRMRRGVMERFVKGDLFHIPFEKRHKVTRQRYSMPGLPCLYLGGSIWVCWEELGRPLLSEMHVSRFELKTSARVLNFGWRPALMAAMIDKYPHVRKGGDNADFVLSQAVCWPLVAACSIRVLHAGAPFVPEYILPQQMLQWLMSPTTKYDGIRYFSTVITQHPDDPTLGANYVFPVRSKMPTGYCRELVAKFKMTEPMLWSLILGCLRDAALEPERDSVLPLAPDIEVCYDETDFGIVEGLLGNLEATGL